MLHLLFKSIANVKHAKLINLLTVTGLDSKDIRIIGDLYWNHSATIKVNEQLSENIQIKKVVRQGCLLSPTPFNVYSEAICDKVLSDAEEGIRMDGKLINNIRYADDNVIITSSLENLQTLLQRVNKVSNKFGLKLNVSKTKLMLIRKIEHLQKILH